LSGEYDHLASLTSGFSSKSTTVTCVRLRIESAGPTHLMLMGGKSGIMYLLNRDHLGGFTSFRDNIVQELVGYAGPLFSTPAFWNSTVYLAGNDDSVKAFTLSKFNSATRALPLLFRPTIIVTASSG
jgi:hypothetical protein